MFFFLNKLLVIYLLCIFFTNFTYRLEISTEL